MKLKKRERNEHQKSSDKRVDKTNDRDMTEKVRKGPMYSFKGCKQTVEGMMGSKPVRMQDLVKKMWEFIHKNKCKVEEKKSKS